MGTITNEKSTANPNQQPLKKRKRSSSISAIQVKPPKAKSSKRSKDSDYTHYNLILLLVRKIVKLTWFMDLKGAQESIEKIIPVNFLSDILE